MPWNVAHLPEHRVVRVVFSGLLTGENIMAAIREWAQVAQQHGTKKCLADCSDLEGGHSVIDLFQLVQMLETAGVDRSVREAIVMPLRQDKARDVAFWETSCRNRGYSVRLFANTDSALEWLATTD